MYNPPQLMTMQTVIAVMREFPWPALYQVEDDLPDQVIVKFDQCELHIIEGFECDIQLFVRGNETGLIDVGHMVLALVSGVGTPGIDASYISDPHDNMLRNLRNNFKILLHHFVATLQGDFRWIEKYRQYMTTQQEGNSLTARRPFGK
jgi:hypothetical protein